MGFEELLMSGIGILGFILFLAFAYLLSRYKRCPSNRILVIYGSVGKGKSAKCIHGGGTFVLPIIQDWKFMSLNPMPIEINLQGALSKQNIRINTPSTFTVAISTDTNIMLNAAERLLGLEEPEIKEQALDIIIGQLRLVIATLTIEEINQDREQFLQLINKHVASELNKIGLHLINVNIKDITDESGYIESIGKKAASEALNQAKVEVAQQERMGAIGHAKAVRERDVEVANEEAQSEEGVKDASTRRRVAVANLEVKAVAGEAIAEKERQIQIAAQEAESEEGIKNANARKRVAVAKLEAEAIEGENTADAQQRIAVAKLEAEAVGGENESKAKVADYEAGLAEKRAEANRRSQVANAESETAILQAEKLVELSLLEKNEVVRREVEKRKTEIDAEAQAEESRRLAKGEADATLFKYQAEAEGLRKLLEAKASGYTNIINSCDGDTKAAATLLLLEKLEALVGMQTEAMSNLQIDKITVWDSGNGNGEGGSTSNFIRNFIGTLPPVHELAKQAGIDLPSFLGNISGDENTGNGIVEVEVEETMNGTDNNGVTDLA
jgi:flotillin